MHVYRPMYSHMPILPKNLIIYLYTYTSFLSNMIDTEIRLAGFVGLLSILKESTAE